MSSRKIQKLNHKTDDGKIHVVTVDKLPPEILEMIFKYLTYNEIGKTVRLVSKGFHLISTTLLNNAFLLVDTKLRAAEKFVSEQSKIVKGKLEILYCHRMKNAIELIKMQYQMLRAVTWRYIHPLNHQKFARMCFYGGAILDFLYSVLAIVKNHYCKINFLHKHIKIANFNEICKTFMNHFEKVSERRVNKSALISGCKAIDILDCLIEGREMEGFRVRTNRSQDVLSVGMVCMKVKYVIKRAWFTCLEVENTANENCWKERQRYMYRRLRRLVMSVNSHLYEIEHFQTESKYYTPQVDPPRLPRKSIYSGYGDYGGQFFYYGNMNNIASGAKFQFAASDDEGGEFIEETDEKKHCMDLVITAEIKCSPELAPLAVRQLLYSDEIDTPTPNENRKLDLYLKLQVNCLASLNSRLPSKFVWKLRAPQRGRH